MEPAAQGGGFADGAKLSSTARWVRSEGVDESELVITALLLVVSPTLCLGSSDSEPTFLGCV
jgi:hypothetical protein